MDNNNEHTSGQIRPDVCNTASLSAYHLLLRAGKVLDRIASPVDFGATLMQLLWLVREGHELD